MTLLSVQNALLSHFLHSDMFIVSRDLDGLDLKMIAKSESDDVSDNDNANNGNSKKNHSDSQNNDSSDISQYVSIEQVKLCLVNSALKALKEKGLIEQVHDKVWILIAPIGQMAQDISISPAVAEVIAETVNQYREAFEIEEGECDKTDIQEPDLINLCNIIQLLLDRWTNDEEDDEYED